MPFRKLFKNTQHMKQVKAGIIGGAGYAGGELIRLLLQHPYVVLSFAHSRSNAGKQLAAVHTDLSGITDLLFTDDVDMTVDVLFLCLGHGESADFMAQHHIPEQLTIIDLANDFRVNAHCTTANRHFIYGLPERNREHIAGAASIANPGCFATAIQLALLPLVQQVQPWTGVYITGITGSTGAGQALSPTSHFSWRANNIQPYKTLVHQHLDEIGCSLQAVNTTVTKQDIHFVPWRGDFARGIFLSLQVKSPVPKAQVYEWFDAYYEQHPFVHVSRDPIHLKQVVNTNRCFIHIEQEGDILVVHAAIDNLLKGASGQAVQNMNIRFGWEETAGLQLKPSFF